MCLFIIFPSTRLLSFSNKNIYTVLCRYKQKNMANTHRKCFYKNMLQYRGWLIYDQKDLIDTFRLNKN